MKAVSNDYKNLIKKLGRQIDAKVSFVADGDTIELGGEDLNSITLHYEGDILKSVMQQLDIDSNVDIPLGTILEAQFGLLVNGAYEYISFGNFIVYSSEKQEDLHSYKIVCYDNMLNAMVDYTTPTINGVAITYPITIRNYLGAICSHLGITFASVGDDFANWDREIPSELFLNASGGSLNYTFRDVLDQLAQVTASTICINEDGELEVRYITNSGVTLDEESLKDINVNFGEKYGAINTIVASRSAESDNVYYPSPLPANPVEIKISDNQFLNGNDRADYLPDIYDVLNGLEYYTNDYVSTGITYLDLCDRYSITIDGKTYSCIMLNDEIQITQGLVENVHTDLPEESVTDYNTSSKDDRTINRTTLIVDKVNGTITGLVSEVENINQTLEGYYSLTQDTNFEENKSYYVLQDGEYVLVEQYSLTDDTTYQSGTNYYSLDGDEYVLLIPGTDYTIGDTITGSVYEQNYAIGDTIPSNTYYELMQDNSLEKRMSQAEATLTSQGAKLNVVSTNIDTETGDILSLKRMNYEMGGSGFIIDDGSGFKSIANTTGQYYYDNNTMTGKYTKDGSVQKDMALFGRYYYGINEDVNVATFSKEESMFVGQLYTNTDLEPPEEGFGHFYNGS